MRTRIFLLLKNSAEFLSQSNCGSSTTRQTTQYSWRINFPSDLVRLGEQTSNDSTFEIDEDERFGDFLRETAPNTQIAYEMPTADPYQYPRKCEQGKLVMRKGEGKKLSFPVSLINVEQLEYEYSGYLVSFYQRLGEKAKAPSKK